MHVQGKTHSKKVDQNAVPAVTKPFAEAGKSTLSRWKSLPESAH
jgi:hypothetical protein